MTRRIHSIPRLFSRREVLVLGAGFGATALGIAPARAATTGIRLRATSTANLTSWLRSSVVSVEGSPVVPFTTMPCVSLAIWNSISCA